MKIKDYIFYRMYIAYKKGNDFGTLNSVLYLSVIDGLIFLPFAFIIITIFHIEGYTRLVPIFIPLMLAFILNSVRYHKKDKFTVLHKKYKNSKYNSYIKNWMLYSLIFIAIAWGFLGVIPIAKLLTFLVPS